jgi:hypothetical protein
MRKPSVGFAMRESEGWGAFAPGSIKTTHDGAVAGEEIVIAPRINVEEEEFST